ncbi:hypothetical protein SNEBB_002299 [Seison nebaliae]|nr:hypothetical protein SNEBB_002299 [Seison nebaliae]
MRIVIILLLIKWSFCITFPLILPKCQSKSTISISNRILTKINVDKTNLPFICRRSFSCANKNYNIISIIQKMHIGESSAGNRIIFSSGRKLKTFSRKDFTSHVLVYRSYDNEMNITEYYTTAGIVSVKMKLFCVRSIMNPVRKTTPDIYFPKLLQMIRNFQTTTPTTSTIKKLTYPNLLPVVYHTLPKWFTYANGATYPPNFRFTLPPGMYLNYDIFRTTTTTSTIKLKTTTIDEYITNANVIDETTQFQPPVQSTNIILPSTKLPFPINSQVTFLTTPTSISTVVIPSSPLSSVSISSTTSSLSIISSSNYPLTPTIPTLFPITIKSSVSPTSLKNNQTTKSSLTTLSTKPSTTLIIRTATPLPIINTEKSTLNTTTQPITTQPITITLAKFELETSEFMETAEKEEESTMEDKIGTTVAEELKFSTEQPTKELTTELQIKKRKTCDDQPCQNDGTCIVVEYMDPPFFCFCAYGFEGDNCERRAANQ